MVIDCVALEPQTTLQCSFNGGPLHSCEMYRITIISSSIKIYAQYFMNTLSHESMHVYICVGSLPLVLTNDVSPPGNHSVRIVASTGPEATVPFFIDSNAVPTGEC